MSRVNFTPKEEECLLEILNRYLPDLEIEIADTDDKDFRKALKERRALMEDFIKRLNAVIK
jgi:hypothetical protein